MTTVEHGVVRARRAGARRALHPLGDEWAGARVRARAAAVAARALPARAGRDAPRPHTHAVRPWLQLYCAVPRVVGWLASALMSCELLLARRSSGGGS